MKILVVDDFECVRNSIKRLLLSCNHDVVTANDGSSALNILLNQNGDSKRIDLVITDYMMDIMNGEELAKEIKNFDHPIPVILISSFSSYLDECPYFDYVLDKPFDNERLENLINKVKAEISALKE